ncbi:hypothetical protein [Haploplasma modicum]|nr:hypothetical protein [Haploplasma modicum]
MTDKNIEKLMDELLNEVEEILYATDKISKSTKTEKIIKILEDKYDF